MTATEQALTKALESLTKVNEAQGRTIAELTLRLKEVTGQLAWFQRQMFGRRSEKNLPDMGPNLFDAAGVEIPGAEAQAPQDADDTTEPDSGKKQRRKSKNTRQTWENLPVLETRTIEPHGVDMNRYRRIGEERSYIVECEPGKLYRVEIVRPQYGLIDSTEPVERGKGVVIAPMPLLPIPKGIPGPGFLTEILLQKFEYHVPFYRQIKQLAHMGMEGVKEATMVGWYQRTMELLRPVYNALVAEIMKSDYCQADETTTPVMNKEKHQTDKEYLWMVRAVMEKLVAFFYDDGSRAGEVIKDLTDEHHFKGYLQCDGYTGYTAAYKPGSGVVLVNCLVHIRRYFRDALDENRKAATWFLDKIKALYHIEHECDAAGMDFVQRKEQRLLRSKPIMDEMKQWMETEGIYYSERTLIGKAVTYAYNRWNNMMNILKDGRLLLDNNLAENEIRPITLGRKNYLFCGNHESAEDMCVITSLLSTCRNHNINPRMYLNSIIGAMPKFAKATQEEISMLLPHKWKKYHPEAIMTTTVREMAK